METNVTNRITYVICIPNSIKDELRLIRHWSHILLAEDNNSIWLKGFTEEEITSSLTSQFSQKTCYWERDGYLFYLNALVPCLKLKKELVWDTVEKYTPIKKPRFNMNFFGLSGEAKIILKPSNNIQPIRAIWTTLEELKPIIETIPKFRIKHIKWTLFNGNQVILFTKYSLPLKGTGFWCAGNIYMPLGLEINYTYLLDFLKPEDQSLLFIKDNIRVYIKPKDIKMLTRSGFRLTTKYIEL